jgi:hypothetical protein
MAHIKSIVSDKDHLKKALSKLPEDGEEELRFRAIRGKRKDDKEESGGLFVGPQMLTAFTKEKEKFVSAQLFDGTIKRSKREPTKRLILVTKNTAAPLKELAKDCLTQAKLPYKIVTLKPGEEEPAQVDEEGQELIPGIDPTVDEGGEETPGIHPKNDHWRGKLMARLPDIKKALAHPMHGPFVKQLYERVLYLLQGPVPNPDHIFDSQRGGNVDVWKQLEDRLAQALTPGKLEPRTVEMQGRKERTQERQRESMALAHKYLTESFPPGLSAQLEKQTKGPIGGSGKHFTPVLTALKMVEKDPSEANLADLEAAARAYLKHVEEDYSDKDKKDDINKLKIDRAQDVLRHIEQARALQKPTDYDSRHTAIWTAALAAISPEAAKLCRFNQPLSALLDQLNGEWDQATELDTVPDEMKAQMKEHVDAIQGILSRYVEQIGKLHQEHPEYDRDWFTLHEALSKLENGVIEDMAEVKVRGVGVVVEQPKKGEYGIEAPPTREIVETEEHRPPFQKLVAKIAGAKDYPEAATMFMAGAETLFAGWPHFSDRLHDDTENIRTKKANPAAKFAELLAQPLPDVDKAKKMLLEFEQDAAKLPVSFPLFGPMVKKAIEDHIIKPAALALQQVMKSPRTEWGSRLKKLEPTLKQALEKKDELAKEIAHQLFLAKQAIKDDLPEKDKDYGRALSLFGTVEKLVTQSLAPPTGPGAKERYEKALVHAQMGVTYFQKTKEISDHRKPQLLAVFAKAQQRAEAGKYEEALSLLESMEPLEKAMLEGELWERKTDVSGYKKTKSIKSGGFGTTWLLGKTDSPGLVLKVPNTPKAKKDLEHEEEFYKKIGNHPNIARCLGMKKVDGQDGLVLEAITGGDMDKSITTLRDRLKKGEIKHEDYWGAMQFTLVRTLEALDYMSSLGYAHVDIKPDNIMYDGETGEIKLIDMGLAQLEGGGTGGTYGYVPPDVLTQGGSGHKGDMFSVGGTAYEVGEGKGFEYNRPGMDLRMALINYAMGGEDALRPQDKPKNEDDPLPEKEVGRYKYETEYVKFVNWLMNPDPKKRPSAREALNHPFLKARLLDDDRAKEVIKSVTKPQPKPPPDEHTAPPPKKKV